MELKYPSPNFRIKKNLALTVFLGFFFAGVFMISIFSLSFVSAVGGGFVSVSGSDFQINGKPFYFSGTNNYYLRYADPNCVAYDPNGGCSREVFNDAQLMNLSVIRTWGFTDGYYYWGSLQPALGVYDEANFQKMDLLIREASDRNIKLIIPFVNNWNEYGGMCQYVSWCNLPGNCDPNSASGTHDLFYTNSCTKDAYKNYVNYFLNRVNSFTGVKYKDDPTIFAWELANEPRGKSDSSGAVLNAWISEMSSYIKSIDSNHLVSTGSEGFYSNRSGSWIYNGGEGVDFIKNHNYSSIDFSSFHLYPDYWSLDAQGSSNWIEQHINDSKLILGKPVLMGEFGKTGNPEPRNSFMSAWYNVSQIKKLNGNLFWELVDKNYPWDTSFGVNSPEDNSTVDLILDDSVYWSDYNRQQSPSNNAPQISPITTINRYENNLVTITVGASDSDGDYIFYSINDAYKFNKLGNVFNWQTQTGDAGNYTFIITASDGISKTSLPVSVNILANSTCTIPTNGMVITRNTVFCSGNYSLSNGMSIGSGISVNCNSSMLTGDYYPGYNLNNGMTVSGQNSTIKNCIFTNYYKGIQLLNSRNITILNNSFSQALYHGINIRDSYDNLVEKNTFIGSSDIGVYAYHSGRNIIRNNNFTYNGKGVYFDGCSNNQINNNYFYGQAAGAVYLLINSNNNSASNNLMIWNGIAWTQGGGIEISASFYNLIANNNISNGWNGIHFGSSIYNTLIGNKMLNNRYNFGFETDGSVEAFINYVDTSNTINNKPIYYLVSHQNEVVPSNAGYVAIVNSSNITVNNVNTSNNIQGIVVAYSKDSTIKNSEFSYTWVEALKVKYSSNIKIQNNIINQVLSSWAEGIYLGDSNSSIIENNRITTGRYSTSMIISASSYNILKNNSFSSALSVYSYYRIPEAYNNSIDTTNTIQGKPIYYYFGKHNFILQNVFGGLIMFAASDNVTVKNVRLIPESLLSFVLVNNSLIADNNIDNNSQIGLLYSHNNLVMNNKVSSNGIFNKAGIGLYYSGMNTIKNNNVSFRASGINNQYAFNNSIINNYLYNNSVGAQIWTSSDDYLAFNTIINNNNGIVLMQSNPRIEYNNIFSNPQSNLQIGVYSAVANNNWWGTRNCQRINASITGEPNLLNYSIILDAPYPGGNSSVCDLFVCSSNADCNDNNASTQDICSNPGTIGATCQNNYILCSINADCGTNFFSGNNFCSSRNVVRNFTTYTCNNPGTVNSYCSNSSAAALNQTCLGTCANGACVSALCANQTCDVNRDGFIDNGKYCNGTFNTVYWSTKYNNIAFRADKWGWVYYNNSGEWLYNYGTGWYWFLGNRAVGTYPRFIWMYAPEATGRWSYGLNFDCRQNGVAY